LNFVRSWVARGLIAENSEAAMADFRRAIRLGRLLRQEDVVVISDLVGLACIHIAARGVYQRALADGDLELGLLASVVLGEVAPQRLRTMEHLTSTDLLDSIDVNAQGEVALRLRYGKLDAVIEAAEGSPDRRMRCEAIVGAFEVLDGLAGDADSMVAESARWSRDKPTEAEQLKEWAVPQNQK